MPKKENIFRIVTPEMFFNAYELQHAVIKFSYLCPWAGEESILVGVKEPIKDPMESSI